MKFEFSAGGIVLRQAQDFGSKPQSLKKKIEVLVCQHSQHHGWVFPKGLINELGIRNNELGKNDPPSLKLRRARKETKEETALREVEEETGVVGKIIQPLPPVTYWYAWDTEKRKKTVYYFIMEYVSGDITKHDLEMEAVEWLPINKVEERLTYDSDKEVWKEAKKMLQ